MGQEEPNKIHAEELFLMIEQLTPGQQEALLNKLNDRHFRRLLVQFGRSDFTFGAAGAWRRLIDRLESGDIDQDISMVFGDFMNWITGAVTDEPKVDKSAKPANGLCSELEESYQELQNNLILVRQAVAQAIATEKLLEQQLAKNSARAATWLERAEMALQQRNDQLVDQARKRQAQYIAASVELEKQLKIQHESAEGLRNRLIDLEGAVHRAYIRKQVLIARDKAAQATMKANVILSKSNASGAFDVMQRMEKRVLERELAASVEDVKLENADPENEQLLRRSTAALENAVSVIERLEALLLSFDPDSMTQDDNKSCGR